MIKKKRLGGKTRVGRLMKRLLGDTAGGVLMEYVVLGLLIVAAVAAAVLMFGRSIKAGFATMTESVINVDNADDVLAAERVKIEADKTKAETHRKSIQNRD